MALVSPNPDVSDTKPTAGDDSPEEIGGYNGPHLCLVKFAADAAAGAFMGSIFGLGSGLVQRKAFKEMLVEGGSSAKTFAILSGVHSLVDCYLKKLRGKDDAINAGVAGCITGLALNVPGSPQAILQGCVTFGAFSFILEAFNKHQEAIAVPLSVSPKQSQNIHPQSPFPVLPPFILPPPFFQGISSLHQSKLHTSNRNCKL
uniref:Mitochondrial import inner membrane translocase subunit TIM22 n=1 Tax=Araucaria cunninghamii TaxID=56994 RepID=A0A0D6R580_ARACU